MCLQPTTCDQLKTVLLPGIREGEKKGQMLRPNPLRVKTGLEKGRDTEHTHMCRPVKMHLQLFPVARWQWGWLP